MEEYAQKYGAIHVISGPIFDYNSDGLADSLTDIQRCQHFVIFYSVLLNL